MTCLRNVDDSLRFSEKIMMFFMKNYVFRRVFEIYDLLMKETLNFRVSERGFGKLRISDMGALVLLLRNVYGLCVDSTRR